MTRFIKDRDITTANAGLQPAQQHMIAEISRSINYMIEADRLTGSEVLAVLERLAEMVDKKMRVRD